MTGILPKAGMKSRLDRALTVAVAHPLSRFLNRSAAGQVPILMYHGISDNIGNHHPYFELNTSPQLFEQQMQYLHLNGYVAMDLAGALNAIRSEPRKARFRPVVITFDDAYSDFYTQGFPVLRKYGFTATVFVITGFTGQDRSVRNGREFMSWNDVREVAAHGISVGSHTVTHPELRAMAPAQLHEEIASSKRCLEDKLGRPVNSFSYPYAFPEPDIDFVGLLRNLLKTEQYENGVSTIIGTAGRSHDPYFLPRLPVNTYDDLCLFTAKLERGYDWLHAFQYANKLLNSAISDVRN
jgi:peptidoglycan/xylan/chitin deacetylase (PgdA/CDA1 family)